MPHRLKQRQGKIQAKRKQTPWREFVMEICSWYPMNYSKNCGLISRYPDVERIYGVIEYKDFFEQGEVLLGDLDGEFFNTIVTLRNSLKMPNMIHYSQCDNSDYIDSSYGANDRYLSSSCVKDVSNVLYSFHVKYNSHNIIGSVHVNNNCENVFESSGVFESSMIFYSSGIKSSGNIWYSSNLIGCNYCIGCDGLVNQSYAIDNKYVGPDKFKEMFKTFDFLKYQKRNIPFSEGTENVENEMYTIYVKSGRNVLFQGGGEENIRMFDVFEGGSSINSDYYCGLNLGAGGSHVYCSSEIFSGHNIFYSQFLVSCSYCLGCIGLKNKSYCIFNKQCTKEERYDKVDEIFSQMEKEGTLGDFFPGSMNPFYFNDTAAYLIDDSFTKEEVEAKGYLRRDRPITVDIPEGVQTVKVSELGEYEGWKTLNSDVNAVASDHTSTSSVGHDNDRVRTIDPEIMKKVIVDEEGNAYRVIPMEYEFLMKHGLPLPRKHRLERIKQHFTLGSVTNASQTQATTS